MSVFPASPNAIPPSPDEGRPIWERFGLAVDRFLNVVMFNGDDTWTVSLHAAVANLEGKRWGCIVCRLLDVLVEKNHCAITLNPNKQEAVGAALRAGLVMAGGMSVFVFLMHFLIEKI